MDDETRRASHRLADQMRRIIARLAVVVDEADESEHWLEILKKAGLSTGVELDRYCARAGTASDLRKVSGNSAGEQRPMTEARNQQIAVQILKS